MQCYLARRPGEAKCDRSAQHVQEVCGHVVPVPARGLGQRLQSPNVLDADATAGHGGEPEVAVLGVLAQSVVTRRAFVVHVALLMCDGPNTWRSSCAYLTPRATKPHGRHTPVLAS